MTASVFLCSGEWQLLPPLLEWRITRTGGEPCDSFFVTFQYGPQWEEILRKAIRFRAESDGTVRFFGIVDEYEVSYSREGLLVTVNGRGLGGLLLDNQVGLGEYYWVRLSDIIRNYVTPLGIDRVEYDQNYQLNAYAVEYGETCWRALSGFCGWAAGIQPRFLADGTLRISAAPGTKRTLEHPERVTEAVWTCCRYGVYSRVVAKNMATGLERTVENQEFLALGGSATRRMTIPRRNSCRAGSSSPEAVLWASAKPARVLKITLKDPFAAEPGDQIAVNLPKLGLEGSFLVTEVETSRDGDGTRCRLIMQYQKE